MDPWFYIYDKYIREYPNEKLDSDRELSRDTLEENKEKYKKQNNITLNGKKIDIHEYEKKCKELLDNYEIRFAGLLDEFGMLIAGGYKQDMYPRLSDKQHQEVCKELASRVEKRKKFDTELCRVKYSASRREHVVIMSFPIYEKVIMVVAEPNVNIDRLSFRIMDKFGKQWGN